MREIKFRVLIDNRIYYLKTGMLSQGAGQKKKQIQEQILDVFEVRAFLNFSFDMTSISV